MDLVDRIQRLVPAFDGGHGFRWILGPVERSRRRVALREEAPDGALEFRDGAEDAALEPLPRQSGEETLHGIEPRSGGRGEVDRPARMIDQPFPDLRMLVGGVVVRNGMDLPAGRDTRLDGA